MIIYLFILIINTNIADLIDKNIWLFCYFDNKYLVFTLYSDNKFEKYFYELNPSYFVFILIIIWFFV